MKSSGLESVFKTKQVRLLAFLFTTAKVFALPYPFSQFSKKNFLLDGNTPPVLRRFLLAG
jgi:hypothetical protein